MNMSIYILLLAFITSCGNSTDSANATDPENTTTPETTINETTEENSTDTEQQEMLLGEFSKEDLQKGTYANWFNRNYEKFEPSKEALETIKNNISDYEIIAFMGTWCADSKREVPKMYKILDEAGYDLSNLTMIGADRNKNTPEKAEQEWNVTMVPTFIFLKDGKEVNRFVEYPVETIEKDIAKIVSGEEYKNVYLN